MGKVVKCETKVTHRIRNSNEIQPDHHITFRFNITHSVSQDNYHGKSWLCIMLFPEIFNLFISPNDEWSSSINMPMEQHLPSGGEGSGQVR